MTCISTDLRTPFGASQAASHESRTRTSSFVGSNSPLIFLKMCSSASFRKSGGSGAPAACALYSRVVPGAVQIRGEAVARMQWDLTTAAGEEKRRAPARIETWGCVHAEAKRWTSALEGAIVRWHTTVYVGFRLTGITNTKLRHSFTTLSAWSRVVIMHSKVVSESSSSHHRRYRGWCIDWTY